MSSFDPPTIIKILKLSLTGANWNKSVTGRRYNWLGNSTDPQRKKQLEARVVEYVSFIHKATSVNGNNKSTTGPKPLAKGIPILGPEVHSTWVPPLTQNGSPGLELDSERSMVFGWRRKLWVYNCETCKGKYGKGGTEQNAKNTNGDKLGSCFATTNPIFWRHWEHWKIRLTLQKAFHKRAWTTRILNSKSVPGAVAKNPRAFLDKLLEMETPIIARISANNSTRMYYLPSCKEQSNLFGKGTATPFRLSKPNPATAKMSSASTSASSSEPTVSEAANLHKVQNRQVSWPEGLFRKPQAQVLFRRIQADIGGSYTAWPLPSGIFSEGTVIHPFAFLATVRELYEKLVVDRAGRLPPAPPFTFAATGAVMFKLYAGFTTPSSDGVPDDLYVDYNGASHLYINSLHDTDSILE
ncbi:hypothetical protein C8R43DRAFT_942795 [Mycena crocata]|nr:hypothetical protein C8R43DRAFT_942795 [Mycena crocata]